MSDLLEQGIENAICGLLPELYTEPQFKAVDAHINKFFGKCSTVFHELLSPDIHCDIYIVPTRETQYIDFVTLITHGAGAHVMNVPSEFSDAKLTRAEFMISLPIAWDVKSSKDDDYWPIRLLKVLSRLPIEEDSWLGPYHTISLPEDFATGTGFKGVILLPAVAMRPDQDRSAAATCELPEHAGDVNFYQVFPLYQDELDLALEEGSLELLKCFGPELGFVVNKSRPSCVAS